MANQSKRKSVSQFSERIWYVVFMESRDLGFWEFFTCEGFEHVACFAQAPSGVMVHNYENGRIDLIHHEGWEASCFASALKAEGKKVLRVRCPEYRGNYMRMFLYCVPLVKSCLGLRKCFAFTPKGLYNWLVNKDYVEEV